MASPRRGEKAELPPEWVACSAPGGPLGRCCDYTSCVEWLVFVFKDYLFIVRRRGWEGERKGEKHQCMREASIDWLVASHTSRPGPSVQPAGMCPDLTQSRTMTLNQVSHASEDENA